MMATISAEIIEFLGGLTVVGGDLDGVGFSVLPWERRFIQGAWRGASDAALSVGRGNGKSALVAGIAAAVVDPEGPLHGRRKEVVCVAASFEQSRIIYEDVLSFLGERNALDDRKVWRKQDSVNRAMLEYRASGCRIRCIGSDPSKAHGLRPALVLADEPAQWDGAKAERMVAALRTGLGKVPGSKLIALGTRPADETHWFARMLKAAEYSQVHAARPGDPPFQLRTVRRANPSVDHLPSLKARIRAEMVDARIDPDSMAAYRALRLNEGVSDVQRSVLLDVESWKRAMELPPPEVRSAEFVLGLDLGTSAAMSAAAAYFRSGELEAVAVLPALPALRSKGLSDGVGNLYVKMADRGELVQAGRRVASIPALLDEVLERWGSPAAIITDRWREAELRERLEEVGFPPSVLVLRGQGYFHGGADTRDFRAAMLGDLVRPSESLLLSAAMAEARVMMDPAGNVKLSKGSEGGRRHRARDDAVAAAVLAVSAGFREWHTGAGVQRSGAYIGVA